jgi:hypothetical protein
MYFLFLWEVLKRAAVPAPRVTDMLQILAASALPATAKFVGIRLPQSAGEDALAYIGLIVVSFFVIRLFWAPYSIWKQDRGEIGGLKLELSKPERLVVEHLARHRAKAIQDVKSALVDLHLATFSPSEHRERHVNRLITKIEKLLYQAGKRGDAIDVMRSFSERCCKNRKKDGSSIIVRNEEYFFIDAALQFFEGLIPVEALERLLPPDTGPEKQL